MEVATFVDEGNLLRCTEYPSSLTSCSQLYSTEGNNETLIAAYHRIRSVINARKPFVELFDGYEGILDLIIGINSLLLSTLRLD